MNTNPDTNKDIKVSEELYSEILGQEQFLTQGLPLGMCWYSSKHGRVAHKDEDGTCWIAASYAKIINLEVEDVV